MLVQYKFTYLALVFSLPQDRSEVERHIDLAVCKSIDQFYVIVLPFYWEYICCICCDSIAPYSVVHTTMCHCLRKQILENVSRVLLAHAQYVVLCLSSERIARQGGSRHCALKRFAATRYALGTKRNLVTVVYDDRWLATGSGDGKSTLFPNNKLRGPRLHRVQHRKW